jgi:hypothetical protein
MSTPYTIGPNGPTTGSAFQAVLPPNKPHDVLTIYNTGQATVYLDAENQPQDTTGGAPLTAGSTLPWDKDLALYAFCPTSTTLVLSENSQIPFDAGAIAAQIIGQGLPGDIAAAINVVGIPPIDRYTVLDTSPALSGNGYASAPINSSGYQSIQMVWQNGGSRIVPGRVSLQWYADAGLTLANFLGFDEFIVGTGSITQFTTPVRGAYFQIVIDNASTDTGSGVLKTFGSYKVAASTLYKGQGAGSVTGALEGSTDLGVQTWSGSIPAGITWTWQPGVVAGDTRLLLRFTTAGTLSYLWRVPNTVFALTTYASATALAIATGDTVLQDVFLPPVPVELSMTNGGGAALTFRATLTNLRPYVS